MQGFYGIADAHYGALDRQTRLLLDGGACAIQLRCKGWSTHAITTSAKICHSLCRERDIPLIINDHILPEVSDGTHLGQKDGSFERHKLPTGYLVGRSTHTLQQLKNAIHEEVDYVGFGPVFPTTTKLDASPTVSLHEVQQAASMGIPVVAIGGINLVRIGELKASGIQAWTAISAIWEHEDPLAQIRAFSRA